MRKELNNLGHIVDYTGEWQAIPNSRTFIKELFTQNNYTCIILSEDGCKWLIELSNDVIQFRKKYNVFLGNIRNESRNDKEKKIQLNGKDPRVIEDGIENIILGVYCYQSIDQLKDYTIAVWPVDAKTNYISNPSIRGINVDLFQEAKFKGFISNKFRDNIVYCFRPEFIHYYLLNRDTLHGVSGVVEEAKLLVATPLTKQPLNQILYGPPGTGKTHNVVNHALSIIKGNDLAGMTRGQIKDEFDALISDGQIQFVTFHQSYSYEEFVEGIKPSVNKGNVEYNIVDGIFKKLCLQAQNNNLIKIGDQFSNSKGGKFTVSRINNEIIELKREEGSIITLPSELVYGLLELLNDNTITIENVQSREKNGTPLQDLLDKKYDKYIFGYDSVLKALLEFMLSREIPNKSNYVLIIDEINRGNISKIFGELITLIEDSKRIGAKEELRTKLTYSGANGDEMFGVPSNVYIIGTMNSADRSIALIDTALRRRFTFFEFTAESTLLSENVEGINLQDLVQMMNNRIEFLLDKDHLLGHAYFINVSSIYDLCSVFRNKVIPLLEEYFYGDYEKIQLVLGDNKEFGKLPHNRIIIPKSTSEQRKIFGKEVDGFEEKILYTINEKFVIEDYASITAEFFTSIYVKTIAEA
jgi:hypothetical protein